MNMTRADVGSGPGRRGLLAAGLIAVPMLLLWLLVGPASAHRGEESYLYLDVAETQLEGRVEYPYIDIRELFGLELDESGEAIRSEVEANLPELVDYARRTTGIGTGGRVWNLDFDGVELLNDDPESRDEPGYAIFPFTVEVPQAEVPRELEITFSPFLAELPNRNNIVLVANDWQRGIYQAEANELLFFACGQSYITIGANICVID